MNTYVLVFFLFGTLFIGVVAGFTIGYTYKVLKINRVPPVEFLRKDEIGMVHFISDNAYWELCMEAWKTNKLSVDYRALMLHPVQGHEK